MQFAGECPHPRAVDARQPWTETELAYRRIFQLPPINPHVTEADYLGHMRGAPAPRLPEAITGKRRCSCPNCSVSMPCLNLAGA